MKKDKIMQLFGNNYQFIDGKKDARFSPFISKVSDDLLTEKSEELGVGKTDYLLYRLLSVDMDELLDLKVTNPGIFQNVNFRSKVVRPRGEDGKYEKINVQVSTVNEEEQRNIRHEMRVTPRCKEEIANRAKELSLNDTEFVEFVLWYRDFLEK